MHLISRYKIPVAFAPDVVNFALVVNNPLRKLTPEECQRLAQSQSAGKPALTPEELEMLEEEVSGKALSYGDTLTALNAMRKRLALLQGQYGQVLDRMAEDTSAALEKDAGELKQAIAQTKERIAGYEAQLPHQN